jgi:pimeloyl-ACP methyl ester carboxylesterase
MGDLLAVLDAVECERGVLFATSDCGFIGSLFAATYPERTMALVLYGTSPTWRKSEEIPMGANGQAAGEGAHPLTP